MISFRYHIVSIVAVFLALALGIVVGTTALNGPITKDLRNQVNDAKKQRDTLAGQVKTLQGQVDDAGKFASTYGAQLVAGSLTGKSVLVVSLPGATSAMQDGVEQQLQSAGAKLSGRLTIEPNFLDRSQGNGISTLATSANRPLGINLPETSDAGKLGSALLAYVLVGKGQPSDLKQVVSGLSEIHVITVEGSDIAASKNVVVIGKGAEDLKSYASSTELALVSALAEQGGKVVVAGDPTSATGGGVIAAVRNDATARDTVASVDDADSAFGQVSTALATAGAIAGQPGHYGTEQGADALYPSPTR